MKDKTSERSMFSSKENMDNHLEDWTEEEAMDFVLEQIADFKSVEEGKRHKAHQALIDNGWNTLTMISNMSEEEISNLSIPIGFQIQIKMLGELISFIHKHYGTKGNVWRDYMINKETFDHFDNDIYHDVTNDNKEVKRIKVEAKRKRGNCFKGTKCSSDRSRVM